MVVRSIEVPWVERVRCGTISSPHAVSESPMASMFKRDTPRRIGSRPVKRAVGASPSRAFPITRRAFYSRYLQSLATAARCPFPAPVRSVRGESPATPRGAAELCHGAEARRNAAARQRGVDECASSRRRSNGQRGRCAPPSASLRSRRVRARPSMIGALYCRSQLRSKGRRADLDVGEMASILAARAASAKANEVECDEWED